MTTFQDKIREETLRKRENKNYHSLPFQTDA